MLLSRIHFPELRLSARDGHKLRGYFGRLFQEHSPLLHNHFEDGSLRYAYPLVQYKVVNGVPMLLGLDEGAKLLVELFLQVRELTLEGQTYPILAKHIDSQEVFPGISDQLTQYRFATHWMALNQTNYSSYLRATEEERQHMLRKILTNHLVAFLKSFDALTEKPIMVLPALEQHQANFKNQPMLVFSGTFVSNVQLPNEVGIGKSVSRGFGTIQR